MGLTWEQEMARHRLREAKEARETARLRHGSGSYQYQEAAEWVAEEQRRADKTGLKTG